MLDIVEANRAEVLLEKVNKALSAGWELHGEPHSNTIHVEIIRSGTQHRHIIRWTQFLKRPEGAKPLSEQE